MQKSNCAFRFSQLQRKYKNVAVTSLKMHNGRIKNSRVVTSRKPVNCDFFFKKSVHWLNFPSFSMDFKQNGLPIQTSNLISLLFGNSIPKKFLVSVHTHLSSLPHGRYFLWANLPLTNFWNIKETNLNSHVKNKSTIWILNWCWEKISSNKFNVIYLGNEVEILNDNSN